LELGPDAYCDAWSQVVLLRDILLPKARGHKWQIGVSLVEEAVDGTLMSVAQDFDLCG
jgi:hypothetical protein